MALETRLVDLVTDLSFDHSPFVRHAYVIEGFQRRRFFSMTVGVRFVRSC